ncbi:hypothetical protein AGOR_G00191660 [Albula goreensis]|uniref:Major facilitator superfamily (MFS) profile domain-containing protein n=1 Tax=Albula goreensis TaxID=1534307 RepID=A0A8T3CQR9_9TELE|nr:hypothetical protein AGOR_G00191660 [Albula goreensis]
MSPGVEVASPSTAFGKNESSLGLLNETEGCLDGWDFSTERYTSTVVTEWNLVCDEAWKAPFAASVYFFGALLGLLVSGHISDRFGRKHVFFVCMALQTICTVLQASSNSWAMYCIFYFFAGVGTISKYNAAFVLGSELLNKSTRVNFSTLGIGLFFALGCAFLPLFAFLIREWRMLLVALGSVGFLFIPLWWFIPESPRWLLSQGRVAEAEAIIRAAAQKNRLSAPAVIFRMEDCIRLTDNKGEHEKLYTIFDLFKATNMRIITIIMLIIWTVTLATFYGLSLSIPKMDGDPYLSCFMSGINEMVGYIIAWLATRYCSRRFALFGMMLSCGVLLLVVQFIPQEHSTLILALMMMGKMAVSAAFCFLYPYCLELFPTVVRQMGLGLATFSGNLGSLITPYILIIGAYNEHLPNILMGGLSVFAGLLSLLLPETRDTKLPEHMGEVRPLSCFCVKESSAQSQWENAGL